MTLIKIKAGEIRYGDMVREMMSDNLRVVDLVKIQFNGMITVHEKGLNTLPFAIFASEDQIVQVWRRA